MREIIRKCLIIVGGEYAPFTEDIEFDYVIACDKGFEYADRMGIKYDLILGDFDSASSEPCEGVPVIRLPAEKDDTDTMYAVKYALNEGFRDIYIACAFGGRLDHTLANIQTGKYVAGHGAVCHLYGVNTEIHCIKDSFYTIKKREHSYLSVFSLSDVSVGVSIFGTCYPAENVTLTSDFPLGVSNEWSGEEAKISVENGILCIMVNSKD